MQHNNQPKCQYRYHPHGRNWAVYRYTENAIGAIGTKVGEYSDREEARQKVYELNGWNTRR